MRSERPWKTARVGDLCTLVNGNAFKPGDWSTSGIPIIRIQNLNDPTKPFNYWADSRDGLVTVENGDVLLAWSGTPGTSFGAHIWRGGSGVLNQHIFRVDITSNEITREWLVRSVNFSLQRLIDRAHGAVGLAHVTKGEVQALAIPLPPLSEQERIAGRLSEQTRAVERARLAAAERLAAARVLPAAYLREVFEGPEASAWDVVRMDEVCDVVEGQVDPREDEYGQLPHVNGENIESGTGRILEARTAAEDGLISGKYLFEAGMVLYSKLRPYLRKVAVAPFRGLCSADMYPLIFDADRVDVKFAMWSLLAGPFTRYTVKESERARMPKLNREQLLAWEMPLPPLADQRQIAAELSRRLADAERLAGRIREELEAIESLPAALLREAFSFAAIEVVGDEVDEARSRSEIVLNPGNFFRRGAIAAYIVNRLHDVPTFGRVHFEKNLYLTEAFVGVNLGGKYRREAAGPLDSDFLYQLESIAAKQHWFTKHKRGAEGFFYRPADAMEGRLRAADAILGDRRDRMDVLLQLTSRMDTEQVEIVATLFAAWNDFLIAGHHVSDALIIEDVRDHWNVSKQKFAPERLAIALKWMRDQGLVPNGIGPQTIRADAAAQGMRRGSC